jgi:hypothetical protein
LLSAAVITIHATRINVGNNFITLGQKKIPDKTSGIHLLHTSYKYFVKSQA